MSDWPRGWRKGNDAMAYRILVITLAVFLFGVTSPQARHLHHERWYQERWCAERDGQVEVRLPDGTRADCITKTNAIEFDFARKFYEAIGQSLYYGIQTGLRPGIVLIIEKPKDVRYWIRLNSVIMEYGLPIDTWSILPPIKQEEKL